MPVLTRIQIVEMDVCKSEKTSEQRSLGADISLARIELAPVQLQAQISWKTLTSFHLNHFLTTSNTINQGRETHLYSSIDIPQPQSCLQHGSWPPRSPQCSAPLPPVPHALRSVVPLSCSSTPLSEPFPVNGPLVPRSTPIASFLETLRANRHVLLNRHGPLPPAQQHRQDSLPNPETSTSQQRFQGLLRASDGSPILLRAR